MTKKELRNYMRKWRKDHPGYGAQKMRETRDDPHYRAKELAQQRGQRRVRKYDPQYRRPGQSLRILGILVRVA